jgi:hypothetical protein
MRFVGLNVSRMRTLLVKSVELHEQQFGYAPQILATDAALYSDANEKAVHQMGVKRVAIPNRSTKSSERRLLHKKRWFRQAQVWRTGCEGRISVLKRRHGLNRCRYRGDRLSTTNRCSNRDATPLVSGTEIAPPFWRCRMRLAVRSHPGWALAIVAAAAVITGSSAQLTKQTLAPHELNNGDSPSPIFREPAALPKHSFKIDSAEEPHLRVVVITKGLHQPWSIAFLPDGDMLVTERSGRLRVVRHGILEPSPVDGVPPVHTGGPRGLQGLMDIALHPRFNENKWVYLAYHKPTDSDSGETVLARGTWNGAALVDVREVFNSHSVDTEASRITFGRDGMVYMSISAPGSPNVQRAQDPNDYAGKTVRLRDDGVVPDDNPYIGRHGFRPAIFTMGHRNGHGLAVNPETGDL